MREGEARSASGWAHVHAGRSYRSVSFTENVPIIARADKLPAAARLLPSSPCSPSRQPPNKDGSSRARTPSTLGLSAETASQDQRQPTRAPPLAHIYRLPHTASTVRNAAARSAAALRRQQYADDSRNAGVVAQLSGLPILRFDRREVRAPCRDAGADGHNGERPGERGVLAGALGLGEVDARRRGLREVHGHGGVARPGHAGALQHRSASRVADLRPEEWLGLVGGEAAAAGGRACRAAGCGAEKRVGTHHRGRKCERRVFKGLQRSPIAGAT